MKIFNQSKGFEDKVNFVDDNNVVLGYDLLQDCCEHADWFISEKPENRILEIGYKEGIIEDFDDYYFDTSYFLDNSVISQWGDKESLIVFRITDGKNEYYIHLHNTHNGYYSHGFNFQKDERNIREGYI